MGRFWPSQLAASAMKHLVQKKMWLRKHITTISTTKRCHLWQSTYMGDVQGMSYHWPLPMTIHALAGIWTKIYWDLVWYFVYKRIYFYICKIERLSSKHPWPGLALDNFLPSRCGWLYLSLARFLETWEILAWSKQVLKSVLKIEWWRIERMGRRKIFNSNPINNHWIFH